MALDVGCSKVELGQIGLSVNRSHSKRLGETILWRASTHSAANIKVVPSRTLGINPELGISYKKSTQSKG